MVNEAGQLLKLLQTESRVLTSGILRRSIGPCFLLRSTVCWVGWLLGSCLHFSHSGGSHVPFTYSVAEEDLEFLVVLLLCCLLSPGIQACATMSRFCGEPRA